MELPDRVGAYRIPSTVDRRTPSRPAVAFSSGRASIPVLVHGPILLSENTSGKGAVVSDAELLVVTFKPIRAGASAELELSAVFLHGAGGALAHEWPAVFRTAIVR